MKNSIPVKFQFDIKTIKKVLALLGDDIPNDEELSKRFFERDEIIFDIDKVEDKQAEFGLCVMIVSVVLRTEQE